MAYLLDRPRETKTHRTYTQANMKLTNTLPKVVPTHCRAGTKTDATVHALIDIRSRWWLPSLERRAARVGRQPARGSGQVDRPDRVRAVSLVRRFFWPGLEARQPGSMTRTCGREEGGVAIIDNRSGGLDGDQCPLWLAGYLCTAHDADVLACPLPHRSGSLPFGGLPATLLFLFFFCPSFLHRGSLTPLYARCWGP